MGHGRLCSLPSDTNPPPPPPCPPAHLCGELERDGPLRVSAHMPQSALQAQIIQLEHHAISVVT